ncbi:Metallo-hydrolase/oxidoreductase [Thozetella sp. PMI_491]|nr:Metallo-hydrolase/oxidoreductase [Thozetella sp. PMI_491]
MAAYSTSVSQPSRAAAAPEDGDPEAHHVKKHGKTVHFSNPHPSFKKEMGSAFAIGMKIFRARRDGKMPTPDMSKASEIPVATPSFSSARGGAENQALRATWLGHACYYVEFPGGLRVLFDPVFEDRCSPVQFFGPKRYTPPPCRLSDLPVVDAVVISHSHYDHLSHPSVLEIQKHHPEAHFFVGLGLERWFRTSGVKKVTELDWWQDAELVVEPTKGAGAKIAATVSCLPCQHGSGRTPSDKDETLWASWAISSGGKSVWFGGDTGYRAVPELPAGVDDYGPEYDDLPRCPQFAEIGKLRGPFDLGMIPIGAYQPRFLWSPVHANPFDAVEIFKDTKCKRAMGIHWGTWALTSEEIDEPPKILKEALRKSGIAETGVFDTCSIGESREF